MNILIFPKKSSNDYISVTERVLSENNKVERFSFINIFRCCKGRRLVIFNWIENQVRQRGLLGYFLVIFIVHLLKVLGFKIVWVKHNKFPHNVNSSFKANLTKKILKFLENKSDSIVCHGKRYSEENGLTFIPHPLYPVIPGDAGLLDVKEYGDFKNSYLIFGRMERYKKIELILANLIDNNMDILIVGRFNDTEYLNELMSIVKKNKLNVRIVNKFLNKTELDTLIKYSKGVIVSNDGDTALVSGVFFHALALTNTLIVTQKVIVEESGLDINYSYFQDSSIKSYVTNSTFKPVMYREYFKNSWLNLLKEI